MITLNLASAFNRAMNLIGLSWRLEFITPEVALTLLKQNPELSDAIGISQRMHGDTGDHTVEAAKGRPHVKALRERIETGKWLPYLGILLLSVEGAVVDGVTRLIAIATAKRTDHYDGRGVWALMYTDTEASDFEFLDDPDSGRTNKDIFANYGFDSESATILANIAPKAAGSSADDGGYVKITRNKWIRVFLQQKAAFLEAVSFVRRERGEGAVEAKYMTALMYFKFVSQKTNSPEDAKEAKRLLLAYKKGFPGSDANGDARWDEARIVKLRGVFHGAHLHPRQGIQPAFTTTMRTLLSGNDVAAKLIKVPGTYDQIKLTHLSKGKRKTKRKAASTGR